MRPAIVHTRNLAALETVVPAWAAGVPVRIHGEHGRDMLDLHGANRKYQWVRRLYRPFVTHYIALSRDLERYLCANVGVPRRARGADLQRRRRVALPAGRDRREARSKAARSAIRGSGSSAPSGEWTR